MSRLISSRLEQWTLAADLLKKTATNPRFQSSGIISISLDAVCNEKCTDFVPENNKQYSVRSGVAFLVVLLRRYYRPPK